MNTRPLFEHRHYVEIARIISQFPYDLVPTRREEIARKFANELQGSNPAYRRDRFMAACQGEPVNWRDRA